MNNPFLWISLLKIVGILFVVILPMVSYTVYAERRVSAYIQDRVGPNRVGPEGLLQPFADVLKLLAKEELIPQSADKFLFVLAPILSCVAALTAFSVVPFGTELTLWGWLPEPVPLQVTD